MEMTLQMEDSLQQTLSGNCSIGIPEAHRHVYILCNLYPQITGLTVETKISLLNIPMPHQGEKWFLGMFYSLPSMYHKEVLINIEPYDPYFLTRDSYSFPLQQNIKWERFMQNQRAKLHLCWDYAIHFAIKTSWWEGMINWKHWPCPGKKTLTVEKTPILQPAVFQDCLSYDFYCSNQHWDQVSLGKRFASSSTSITEGARVGTKAGGVLKQKSWVLLLTGLFLVSSSAWLLIPSRTTCTGWHCPEDWAIPHQ